jgi:hypothetical protein
MELNSVLRIIRSIAKNTSNAEITIKLNPEGNVTRIELATDNANLAFFNGLYKVLSRYALEEDFEMNEEQTALVYFDIEEPEKIEEEDNPSVGEK